MRVLPIHAKMQTYNACCGNTICAGCLFQHQIKSQELAAERGQTPGPPTCAFCRELIPKSNEESLPRIRKRVERKDPKALYNLALKYGFGAHGITVDQSKCIGLLRQSAGLGCLEAQYSLGNLYDDGDMGLEQNSEEAYSWWEKAAEGGHVVARHNLGVKEAERDDCVATMRHCRLSAAGGYRNSMDCLVRVFADGFLRHGDLAITLQAFYRAKAEVNCKDRDQYNAYLKMKGEWNEDYDE